MELPEVFYDVLGNEVTLDTLCVREPYWAANRIRRLSAKVDELESRVEVLEDQLSDYRDTFG